jgi:NADH:ubiquinone oxidoreductase subunit 3 (subunit A)
MNSESLVLFFIIAIVLVGGAILFATFVAPSSNLNPAKFEAYECGIPAVSPAWIQFNVGYYLYAIIFLVFDVETVFIFPWGIVMREIGLRAFVEILIFFVILGLGLLYAWRKKALKWA